MSSITYRRADYAVDREQILKLYCDVFHIDFTEGYDKWFCDQNRKAIGIVAVDGGKEKIVGHWCLARFEAVVAGQRVAFRQSLGTMTDAEYRGQGIAATLFKHLRQAVIKERDTQFVIGFPNEASYRMLVGQLDFVFLRDYHFVVLPRRENQFQYKEDHVSYREQRDFFPGKNYLLHSAEYMEWHYCGEGYDKWQSENGHTFISARFMDKADILYWSEAVTEEELLDFAAFLYTDKNVKRVTTWNSATFLDKYPAEARNYHMCIQCLDTSPADRDKICKDWFFYMGDCDLF